jgi:hypothetical protein
MSTKKIYESRIQYNLFIINCTEKELSAQLEQNPKISKKYIKDMQTIIATAKKSISTYESRIEAFTA